MFCSCVIVTMMMMFELDLDMMMDGGLSSLSLASSSKGKHVTVRKYNNNGIHPVSEANRSHA
jgi:hypothetical protein